VSIQAQILNLLQDLQDRFQLTYIFVSHAMSVVRYVSNRIAVMYAASWWKWVKRRSCLLIPSTPYTEMLLAAVPRPSQRGQAIRRAARGEPPDLADLPSGCVFHPRCKYVQDVCREEEPHLRDVGLGTTVSCHLAESLVLEGIRGAL
jgi:peptide/nickel transport system ATP-binding protein